MRRAISILVLLLVSALGSAAASAAPTMPASGSTSPWCLNATKYATSSSMANLSAKNTPGRLKDTYALYKRNRSAILSGAPGQIKAPLTLIFSFDDKFFAALAKANWNAAAINPADLQAIVSQTQKILPATRTVIKYFNKHCGTHIAVP